MKRLIGLLIVVLISSTLFAQGPFAPPADSAGTTAIHKDSSIVAAWVQNCTVTRGPQHLPNSNSPLADVGSEASVYGYPDGDVLSLGDGGYAVIELIEPLANHHGFDFAVFENGIYDLGNGGYFLELAFVEVSSNGVDFYRFPNQSLTPTDVQTNPFGYTNASDIHNLAGKYLLNYGTPFDLDDLDSVSALDIQAITHIKIIDVVGSIDPAYGSFDSFGRIINDPFPTSFNSGGFDLDAVAIVDSSFTTSITDQLENEIKVYPNPFTDVLRIDSDDNSVQVVVTDLQGKQVEINSVSNRVWDVSNLPSGIYFVSVISEFKTTVKKVVKF